MNYEQKFFNVKNFTKNQAKLSEIHNKILLEYKSKKFDCLSITNDENELNTVLKYQDIFSKFDNLIFMGTGGSSLGGKTLVSLKRNQFVNFQKPNFFFIENIDIDSIESLLKNIELEKTGFIVTSKSGETIETLCQYFTIKNFLKKKKIKLKKNILVITEKKNSTLKQIQETSGYLYLEHKNTIGGRFSIFSVVGLLPGVLAGLDIFKLREGGMRVIENMLNTKDLKNFFPGQAALCHVNLIAQGFNQCVLMPYSDKLVNLSMWFRQLWGESIGKQKKGSTPINAIGTVDQHSQLQLYLDGPRDKFITFVSSNDIKNDMTLDCKISKNLNYKPLHKKKMSQLLSSEETATFETLKKNKIPIRILKISSLNEYDIGNLLMHFFLETIYTCYLLKVNPFDQPAVEEGKKLAIKILKET